MTAYRKTLVPLMAAMACVLVATRVFAAETGANADVEAKVRAAFSEHPEMMAVAQCESGYRQFAPDGSVLRGGSDGRYVGIFQIDEHIHAERAKGLGDDIFTVDGNIAYAKWLFDANGGSPWKGCLPKIAPALSESASAALTLDMKLGLRNAQVALLQRILNGGGFAVATDGAGSAGHETEYFGGLTREAVRKFQCAKKIVCDGAESTTGYGRVGPRTRAALNALVP